LIERREGECNAGTTNKCFQILFQGLNPGKAIAEIKKLLAGIAKKDAPGLQGSLKLN